MSERKPYRWIDEGDRATAAGLVAALVELYEDPVARMVALDSVREFMGPDFRRLVEAVMAVGAELDRQDPA